MVGPAGAESTADDASLTTATLQELQGPSYLRNTPYLRIGLQDPGIYRLTATEIKAAGLDPSSLNLEQLALWNEGEQVPLQVETSTTSGGRQLLHVEWQGQHPAGTFSYYKVHNLRNIYFLTWNEPAPRRYQVQTLASTPETSTTVPFHNRRHFEPDHLYLQETLLPGVTDRFFWSSVVPTADPVVLMPLDFPGIIRHPESRVELQLRVFGKTNIPAVKPGHLFDAFLGEYPLGKIEFDGLGYHTFSSSVPLEAIKRAQRLQIKAPAERMDAVDQIFVDSLEVSYPRLLNSEGRDLFTFFSPAIGQIGPIPAAVQNAGPGARVFVPSRQLIYQQDAATSSSILVQLEQSPTTYTLVSARGTYRPERIEYIAGGLGEIAQANPQAKATLLYGGQLEPAALDYARYRCSEGLALNSYNVDRVYDALNNGFASDVVIKRFVRSIRERSPSFKNLVLFGDSTYDYRLARHKTSFPAPEVHIPIHFIHNPQTPHLGGYSDDNWYGSFDYPNTPQVGVGRIPAGTLEQAYSYLKKLIEYEKIQTGPAGPALLLTGEETHFQDLVKETQKQYGDRFTSTSLLWAETQSATTATRESLIDRFNQGLSLLYYVGHGGAMVWRVGQTDFQSQTDLFTPEQVRNLKNKQKYPIITCSSCYTTTFDMAESMGEAFLFSPDRGAIAVIGASWKATVYEGHSFNTAFIDALSGGSFATVGEAFQTAKFKTKPPQGQVDFGTFTFLGDPCLSTARLKQ